jgi:hypothetical protein
MDQYVGLDVSLKETSISGSGPTTTGFGAASACRTPNSSPKQSEDTHRMQHWWCSRPGRSQLGFTAALSPKVCRVLDPPMRTRGRKDRGRTGWQGCYIEARFDGYLPRFTTER